MTRLSLLLFPVLLAACSGESEAERLARARTELAKPDLAAAVVHLKSALKDNPNAVEARLLLGKALLASGDAAAAQIELRRALDDKALEAEALPDLVRAMVALGEGSKAVGEFGDRQLAAPEATAELKTLLAGALAERGETDRGRELLQQALQTLPGHAGAMVLNARLDAGTGQLDNAVAQLDEVLGKYPGHEGAGLLKGEILRQARNDGNGALALFRQVRAAHPRSVPAHVAIVGTLLQQGQVADARTELAPLLKIGPRHPDTLILQAQLALAEKNYKGTREVCERLLAAAPNHVRLLLLAGAAEMGLQNHTLAIGFFGRALKVAPDAPTVRQLMARSLLVAGEADRALEVLKPLLDAPQVDSTTWGVAGEAWLMAGDSRKSEAAFQQALKAAPADNRLRTALATVQLARGPNGPALAQLEAIARDDSGPRADLALISARLRLKDLSGALKAIDALQAKQPGLAQPLVLRGRVHLIKGDTAAARASLESALKLQPHHLPALVSLAEIDVAAGQLPVARKRFEELIKAEPKNVNARMALADFDRRLGAPDAAVIAQLRDAVRASPSDTAPHLALVARLMSAGDGAAALAAAQEANAAVPNDPALMDALGVTQLATGERQAALSTFKRLAALHPRNPMVLARLADAHLAGQDTAGANAALKQALQVDPEHAMAQRGLALVAQMDQRPQDALAIARGLQRRRPTEPVGFALEGELQARGGHWSEAASAYAAALQRAPATDSALRLHDALLRAGKAGEAERMAAEWQRAQPKDATLLVRQGDLAAAAKEWSRAERLYRDALALQPRHAVVMNNVAYLLALQKKPGAVAMAEQALAILPDKAFVLDTLSLAQEADDQLGKAIDTQKRAAELEPRNPLLRLRLARLHLKRGDKAEARELLQPLARLGPSFGAQDEVGRLLRQL